MKSACLVCKQLNAITTPYLYSNMEITSKFLEDDRFTATITKTHSGLPSVQTLRILAPDSPEQKLIAAICQLLSSIPEHSLACFEYA
jgi:hypothetical protein